MITDLKGLRCMLHVWSMLVRVIHAPNILASLPRPLGGEAGVVVIPNSNPGRPYSPVGFL